MLQGLIPGMVGVVWLSPESLSPKSQVRHKVRVGIRVSPQRGTRFRLPIISP